DSAAQQPPAQARLTGMRRIDYGRDVEPILSTNCFSCHGAGASAEEGRPRLDRRESSTVAAIIPGRSADSPLMVRVSSPDAGEQMPPSGGGRRALTAEQIAVLRQWIDEGARYTEHWSFGRSVRSKVPDTGQHSWVRNAVDAFIAAEHARRGMTPSPEADRTTLLRRLSFDIIGLPPSPAEVADFVSDPRPDAYERAVDRLLASGHFGERMAMLWLDLVRYADTDGYSKDYHRDVWMYRDFVIDSFNQNKPFDQFTREQLAGDLLPNPSREVLVGSGYNRLQMTSQGGCADPKEYTHRYAADRVRNVASVWLGVTLGCAECHDHKFDPFTARDFYRMAALFADIREIAVGPQEPTRFSSAAQEAALKRLDGRIADLDAELTARESRWHETRIDWEKRLRDDAAGAPAAVVEALGVEAEMRNVHQKLALTDYFRATTPEFQPLHEKQMALRSEREALLRIIPATLVTSSGERRVVRILPRGNWADDSGEVVTPGFPASLSGGDRGEPRAGRLNLADWLTSRDNPLVARVFVNRLWKMAFGKGLVATPDDFGVRGVPPTHPELLDWLAVEFVEGGWNVKAVLKLILMSNTYRQSSDRLPGNETHDPDNRWLTRQNRFPLDAELVRDNALAVSGLLTTTIGGRSVKPYQPDGYWTPRFSEKEYRQDHAADLYRRGLYTYWCRNYLHPALAVFDAPSRRSCTADRVPSSTPLQALVLLNDPTYAEAARVLAERIVREGGNTPEERVNLAMQLGQSRRLRHDEESLLTALYRNHLREFAGDREAALAVVQAGEFRSPDQGDVVELAAWTSVAKVILNLHETVTRR
ncbi:MAG: PSD1 and planctomycete cytochrome C domain-containing protein, partial [Deltaproteobacteria bacterium]